MTTLLRRRTTVPPHALGDHTLNAQEPTLSTPRRGQPHHRMRLLGSGAASLDLRHLCLIYYLRHKCLI